jgi:hypothetical protein
VHLFQHLGDVGFAQVRVALHHLKVLWPSTSAISGAGAIHCKVACRCVAQVVEAELLNASSFQQSPMVCELTG